MASPVVLPLALTQGDPSGIGPELSLKCWLNRNAGDRSFFFIGDLQHLRRTADALGIALPVAISHPREAAAAFSRALPVLDLGLQVVGAPGKPEASDAAATIASIERAVECVAKGEAAAVVTNPIAKSVLYATGFAHPGHTEFLGEIARRHWHADVTPIMMLWCPDLAVVPLTVHVPLHDVPPRVTREAILATARGVVRDLRERFDIGRPRLAIAGLNPHAGEAGTMGNEEVAIIAPAVAELRAEGIDATGPLPADTMFHARARKTYDVAIAMYHDQALIPIKTIAFDSAVNVTLGLPFIRTSPDHGTAFDIAGTGVADPASLQAALRLAGRLARRAADAAA